MEQSYGRYQIESELGRGGMSTVYLAHDPRFGRKVALKVMSRGLIDDPRFRGRFEREAHIIASLEHLAIVAVYDFGEDHEQPYLVMRYMPGGTLADRIIAGPLSLETAVPIIQRLAGALDHAHEQGVIHRDLKPSNILFDRFNNAFLTDFGIVKLVQGSDENLTGSGVIGTPAYMSPEQIHGEKALDGRSDIYTMGIILFEMLTGRKPYHGDTPVKQMMAHVLNPIPQIREIRPELPVEFEEVVSHVLAKERDDRFATGIEFAEAITPTLPSLDAPKIKVSAVQTEKAFAALNLDEVTEAIDAPTEILRSETPTQLVKPIVSDIADEIKRKRAIQWIGWPLAGLLVLLAILWGPSLLSAPDLDPTSPAEGVSLVLPTQVIPSAIPTATFAPAEEDLPPTVTDDEAVSPSAPLPTPVSTTYGQSANDQPLEAVRIGTGESVIVVVGGLHAGFAPGSVDLAQQMIAHFSENLADVPPETTLIIVPNANPDSLRAPGQLAGRINGNGVDLNRNWDCRWTPNPPWGSEENQGLGGAEPFSEPEVRSLANLITSQQSTAVIFWQARASQGLVSPGGCNEGTAVSQSLATIYGEAADFSVADFENLVNTVVNGDATNWLDQQGIPAISVLLTDYTATNFAENLAGIEAVMAFYANQPVEQP